eukprot:scaffold1750_cov281-Prasinococcus_capsulatus_cf.AAC.2
MQQDAASVVEDEDDDDSFVHSFMHPGQGGFVPLGPRVPRRPRPGSQLGSYPHVTSVACRTRRRGDGEGGSRASARCARLHGRTGCGQRARRQRRWDAAARRALCRCSRPRHGLADAVRPRMALRHRLRGAAALLLRGG